MIPDYDKAAIKATETLIANKIDSAPVSPLPILKRIPGTLVLSFLELSSAIGVRRNDLLTVCGEENQDAVTAVHIDEEGHKRYLIAYNQKLPFFLLQRALARELGHIVLNHDGTKPEEVRMAEALAFARHLLCPRALIYSIQNSSIPMTVETLRNMTGCDERCLEGMRTIPATKVTADLNRKVRQQFTDYIVNYIDFATILSKEDKTPVADFGSYMEGYEE